MWISESQPQPCLELRLPTPAPHGSQTQSLSPAWISDSLPPGPGDHKCCAGQDSPVSITAAPRTSCTCPRLRSPAPAKHGECPPSWLRRCDGQETPTCCVCLFPRHWGLGCTTFPPNDTDPSTPTNMWTEARRDPVLRFFFFLDKEDIYFYHLDH